MKKDMVWAMRENLAFSSHQWMRREFAEDLKFVWDEGASAGGSRKE